ncbi:MAG: hypothetical protein GY791_14805 [Alphaproteobacteria bacterium]|nr:hypothetical protein [Alphaproteobacteria bacterium]
MRTASKPAPAFGLRRLMWSLAVTLPLLIGGPNTAWADDESQDENGDTPATEETSPADSESEDTATEDNDEPNPEENVEPDPEHVETATTERITILVIGDGGDGSDAAPVEGVAVTLTRRAGTDDRKLSEITRGNGEAVFKDVEYGTVVIRAHKTGYKTGGDTLDLDEPEESVTIIIEPAPPPEG